jgi:hypothetical protein
MDTTPTVSIFFLCILLFMNIQPRNLGIVSGDEHSKVKFILLEDGMLLYGKCQWHKDLEVAAKFGDPIKVIGAGVVPENIQGVSIEDNAWGDWKSTGYEVVTPTEFREPVRNALSSMKWKGEILLESLHDSRLLDTLHIDSIEEIQDDDGLWHVYCVSLEEPQIAALGVSIKEGPWFIHFTKGEEMIVVFKDAYFKFSTTDRGSIEKVREHGRKMHIPEEEMQFDLN